VQGVLGNPSRRQHALPGDLAQKENRGYGAPALITSFRDTGEGKTFIGQTSVTTNANGTSSINNFIADKTVPVGQSITATATDTNENTSEFTGEPRSVRSAL
jgi:hypothetical protein